MNKLISFALAATVAFGGIGAAAASASAAQPATPSSTSTESLQHRDSGSWVEFNNHSGGKYYLSGHLTENGNTYWGNKADGDDVSFRVGLTKESNVPIYAHNPQWSEAYLQIGGQKFHNKGSIIAGGMEFKVEYLGSVWRGSMNYKKWNVTFTQVDPYVHKYVHHTDSNDGVKGAIINNSNAPVELRVNAWGSQVFTLAPKQRMLFFDGHSFDGGWGIKVEIRKPGDPAKRLATLTASDGSMALPSVKVERDGSGTDRHGYSEGESKSYSQEGSTVEIKRFHDNKLPYGETWETSDWALFDFVIR